MVSYPHAAYVLSHNVMCVPIVTKIAMLALNPLLAIKQPLKVVFVFTFTDLKVNISYVGQYYFIFHSLYD
jgi:hypothetical protein